MEKSQSRMDNFAVALARWMIRLRWIVIFVTVGASVYIGTHVNLSYSSNYRAFFSAENPELRNFEEFQNTYIKSDNFLFVFRPKDGGDVFTNETLQAIGEFSARAWRLPYATRVDSITNFQHSYAIGDELIVEDLVPSPGGGLPGEIAAQKETALGEPLLNGLLISEDSKATVVNVVMTYPEASIDEVPETVAAARALRAEFEAAYPDLEIFLSGTSMLNNAFGEAIQSDFKILIPLMFALIIFATIIAVRSVSATLSTLALVILSCTVAMGWAGYTGILLAGPSPSATIVILTLAIADSIHVLMTVRSGMRGGLAKREAIIEAIRINFTAITVTSLTTIIGFMALNFSDSPPFRDFGNISAVGIFAAWFLSITFLPAILSLMPLRVRAVTTAQQVSIFRHIANVVIDHHRKLLVLTAAICAGLIAMIPTLEINDEFRKYFDERIEFRADTDEIVNYFGFYPLEFSVQAGEAGGVANPEFLDRLEAFTEWLRQHPDVKHVYSLTDVMKRLNKNLNGNAPEDYRLPEDRDLAAQYLLLYELSLPYGLDLNDRINIDKSATRVTATMKGDITSQDTRRFMAASRAWFEENAPELSAPVTGAQVMFTFIAKRNIESMVAGSTVAVILIALTMMISLRSMPMGLLSMIPNSLPILTGFGVWALTIGVIGFSVAAVASLSLGIVVDDTVHFLTKYVRARREKGLSPEDSVRHAFETVGAAIFFNTMILLSGFLVLTFSAFKINYELGLLTSMVIVMALILDFLMLPGILLITAKRDKQ